MQGVTVVDHPLVRHKLTLMRKKDTSIKSFRQLLNATPELKRLPAARAFLAAHPN